MPNQQAFYEREVAPVLAKGADRRVFVIISDAFRYEAAQELAEQLNGKYRFDAELSAQLGVLPSYTGLGMAALLPHKALDYSESGAIRVDGLPCGSLEQRAKVLESVQGVAVKAETFMAMKKDEGRAFIKPYRVVYVYHNQVDAVGDSASTEDQTFGAVRKAIDELADLVSKIVNSLNGNYLLITADHGFLFRETPPGETDKNSLSEKPAGTLLAKKRYLLGRNLPENDKAYHGSTAVTAGAGGGMEFWVPKGANRFHFVGGSRFIHGGRHAAGGRRPGHPGTARQGDGQGGQDQDAHRRRQRARQQLQDHDQPAPLPAHPDRAGRRAGQAGDPEGRHL